MEQGMNLYRLNPRYAHMIVDAIVEGYRDYIEIRKKYRNSMAISSAFAWTKGNFIEHKVAERARSFGFHFKRAKAGMTWDYLQFIHDDDKLMFVIKDAAYFLPTGFTQSRLPNPLIQSSSQRTYLHELSRLNQHIIFSDDHKEPSFVFEEEMQQGEFDFGLEQNQGSPAADFFSHINEFHILTYALDSHHQMSEIMHYLPNPDDNLAYVVEDLSPLITGAELSEDDRRIFAPDEDEYMRYIAEFEAQADDTDKPE